MYQPNTLIIESQYLGSIHYYARLLHHKTVWIEQEEHYEKGTYRNRCHIVMPDGLLRLSIPLEKGKHQRRPMKDIRISYNDNWQKLHWRSLETAYRSSPYFEYYEDDFQPFYTKKYDYLIDFNQKLCTLILGLLEEKISLSFTNSFEKKYSSTDYTDFRSFIHPKPNKQQIDPLFTPPTYHQVFENKLPFVPNLSIIDLLFAEGPQTASILRQSIKE